MGPAYRYQHFWAISTLFCTGPPINFSTSPGRALMIEDESIVVKPRELFSDAVCLAPARVLHRWAVQSRPFQPSLVSPRPGALPWGVQGANPVLGEEGKLVGSNERASHSLRFYIPFINSETLIPNPWERTSIIGRQTFFFPLSISEMCPRSMPKRWAIST